MNTEYKQKWKADFAAKESAGSLDVIEQLYKFRRRHFVILESDVIAAIQDYQSLLQVTRLRNPFRDKVGENPVKICSP